MAVSTDERREVAARLRSVNGAPEWATTACCIAECLGEHDYPLWNDSKPLFKRLADLIEPEERTCLVVDVHHGPHGITEFELSCGHGCEWVWDSPPAYCTACGAKVVE